MRLVFLGTPAFALPSLKQLNERFGLTAVVTQPDRPAGRGQRLTPPPVKREALKLGLPVYQPRNKEELVKLLKELKPDAAAVVAFGMILPKEALSLCPFLNLHASLLPKYRGAAPIQRALMAGEKVTGNTVMLITEKLDAGPILLQEPEPIDEEDNYATLSARLAEKGAPLLTKALELYASGRLTPKPQNDEEATYAPPIKKEELRVCWRAQAESVRDRIRALYPNAYAFFNGKRVKLLKARVFPAEGEPGQILPLPDKLVVACGEKAVEILELITPKGRRVTGKEFVKGYRGSFS
ncbi:MAG: methionyl-tRNA formyltransferase [Aquificae bacterium]|nr:methionyl-tRNA formyltransferase [Aquificota bacterium]